MSKMINWLSSDVTTPDLDREVILKNSTKIIFDKPSGSRCELVKFNSTGWCAEEVYDYLGLHLYDLWAYTDEGDQHE